MAIEKVEESRRDPVPEVKANKLVHTKVRRLEDLTRAKEGKMRSPNVRSLKKVRNRVTRDGKMHAGIKRFLMAENNADSDPKTGPSDNNLFLCSGRSEANL